MNYRRLVRDGSFLATYMDYMSIQETPTAYDFWCGVYLIGNALGRGVIIDRPRAPVYMNWYMILVAEAATTRKSTAIRSVNNIMRQFNEQSDGRIEVIQSMITPEKLLDRMQEISLDRGQCHIAFASSELVSILGRERYTAAMPGLLTDIYDPQAIRAGGGTLARGVAASRNTYVTFLSASTPAWLLRAINPDVIEGGFTSRCIFIHEEHPKRLIAWPEEHSDGLERERSLVAALCQLREQGQRFTSIPLAAGARDVFQRWYSRRPQSRDTYRRSFEGREDTHVLRLAACLSINDDRWAVEKHDINRAIEVIKHAKERGAAIFESTYTDSRLVLGIDRLRLILLGSGRSAVSQTKLVRDLQRLMRAEQISVALEIMHELDMVQKFEDVPSGMRSGRPKTMWRATTNLSKEGALERVLLTLE